MKCPVDGATLQMSERNGIEIDYCQDCRGIWLDRGELDKIIERSDSQPRQTQMPAQDTMYRRDDRSYEQSNHQYGKRKKKESFLGDLFDF